MTAAEIEAIVSESRNSLRSEESFTWVLLMCTLSLAASIVVILVLL
jgi:hypothetical protein